MGGWGARRVAVAVEVLRPGGVRVHRRLRLLLAGALGCQQVLQAPRRHQGQLPPFSHLPPILTIPHFLKKLTAGTRRSTHF
jgi:hypothetical protein